MSTYIDNAVGASSSTGLDPYLISGSVDQYGPMIGVLTNGASYCYRAVYVDPTVGSDYETGVGVWNSGTNTLSRATINTSSNSNAAVNWGAGEKVIYIVADSELMTDMEQMVNGATKFYLTGTQASNIAASKTKTDLITVTVPANLDTMQSDIAAFSGGMTYRGNWDASTGVFPGGGVGSNGDYWYCSVSGVVDTVSFDAGDSIVALVNNPSISVFAGNWSRHDSLDAVQSVAGLTGTITADNLNAAIHAITPFDYKPAGEPILLLCIGDSNMVGIGGTDGTLTLNPNVYVYSTPGTSAWSASDLAWFNNSTVDPAGPEFTNRPTAPTSFTGILRANNGDTGYAAATRLQERTGRDVYMFHTAQAGKTMAYWLPGGGAGKEGMNALIAQLPTAFSSMPETPPFFDVVIMSDSTNDAGTAVTPDTFLANFTSMYDYMVSQGWIDTRYTRWFQLEAPQVYPDYAAGWLGLQYLSNAYGERVQILSSVDLPVAVDNTHFEPAALQLFGANAADCTLSGLTPKSLVRPGSYVETLDPVFGADVDFADNDLLNVGVIHADPTPASPFTVRVDGSSSFDLIYQYDDAFLDATILTQGGPNGALYRSRMTAGVGAAAHSFSTTNTLSGSDQIAAFSHNGLLNAVTISRLGLITAASGGGFSTTGSTTTGTLTATTSTTTGTLTATGATVLSYSTVTVPTATVVAVSTPSVYLNGQLTHNFANSYPGYRVDVAETHISQQATSFVAGAVFAARSTFKNQSGFAGTFAGTVGFLAADTFQSDTVNANIGFGGDFSASPTFGITGGATTLAVTLYNHYASAATLGSGVTITSRGGYQIGDKAGGGTVTSQAALVSNITSSGATNTTHVLMGTSTIPTGNFGVYQSDTFPNRFNGPICAPWLGQSGSTPLVATKGTRTYVFANGSTSTITLPTLTSMTTGHTAAQMSGYELVIINDRTTAVVSGTDFLLGAGTSFGFGSTLSIAARDSRTFVWNGVDTWL